MNKRTKLAATALAATLCVNVSAASVDTMALQKTQKAAAADNFKEMVPGLLNDHIVLGTAYNSDTKEFLNVQTVAGYTDETLGNTLVQVNLETDNSYDEVLKQLNGNVDIDVSFPVIRVDAGGHIAKEMAETEFSSSYTFKASLTPKKRVLKPRDSNAGYTLTTAGDILARQYQAKLMKLAGDSFVSEIEYGALLLINMKIEYLNERDKSDIGGYLGVSYGAGSLGISVDGKLNYIDEELKRSVRITVRALQKGGDPKQLLNVIPNNIVSCSLDNYQPCFNMFEQAVKYAQQDFGKQFNSQSDYNVVRYKTTPYSVSSTDVRRLDSEDQVISFETTYRTLWLEEQFKKSINHENRASSMISKYGSWMSTEQRETAAAVKDAAYSNAWVYSQYATLCRDNPYGSACADSWNNYLATCSANSIPCLENYTLSDLNIPSEDATQYYRCEAARDSAAALDVEDEQLSIGYRQFGWAPVFADADDPKSGIIAWLPCKQALTSYDKAFPQ